MEKSIMSLENFENAGKKFEEMQRIQARFASQILDESLDIQKKQYTLLVSMVDNQMEFGKMIFTRSMDIMNDNLQGSVARSPTKK